VICRARSFCETGPALPARFNTAISRKLQQMYIEQEAYRASSTPDASLNRVHSINAVNARPPPLVS